MSPAPYALALLSPIPVTERDGAFHTLDLWARDLEVQVRHVSRLRLICPVASEPPPRWGAEAPLPAGVQVVPPDRLRDGGWDEVLDQVDAVQVSGNQGWFEGSASRRLLGEAQRRGIPAIVGISSNRARAALLNARGPLRTLRALVRYASIRATQRLLTRRANGSFVIGGGLRGLVSTRCPALLVGVASWIRESDLEPARRRLAGAPAPLHALCCAAKLERMKGTHLAVEALHLLATSPRQEDLRLTILGAGPERDALGRQVTEAGLDRRVTFGGTRSYPDAFFEELRGHGVVLLTNLGDEQPRLIFDAISQGCLPLCPDVPAYGSLGLPDVLHYRRGDAAALALAIERLRAHPDPAALWSAVLDVASRHTLEGMHRERAAWIRDQVLGAGPTTPSSVE